MADLIYRDSVLESLKKASIGGYITDRIKDIPAVNSWIPCSERIPDENSDEWCVGITSTGKCIAFISKNAYENDIGGVSVPTYFNHGSPITHWMPLPEPPKE